MSDLSLVLDLHELTRLNTTKVYSKIKLPMYTLVVGVCPEPNMLNCTEFFGSSLIELKMVIGAVRFSSVFYVLQKL